MVEFNLNEGESKHRLELIMPSYEEWKKNIYFYYCVKFTLNVYSMLFSVSGIITENHLFPPETETRLTG